MARHLLREGEGGGCAFRACRLKGDADAISEILAEEPAIPRRPDRHAGRLGDPGRDQARHAHAGLERQERSDRATRRRAQWRGVRARWRGLCLQQWRLRRGTTSAGSPSPATPPPITPPGASSASISRPAKFERVYESVNGERLSGPNDIVFEKSGAFWFTDLGKSFARAQGTRRALLRQAGRFADQGSCFGSGGLNGVGLSPDEKVVYAAETETARLWAFDIIGEGEVAPRALGYLAGASSPAGASIVISTASPCRPMAMSASPPSSRAASPRSRRLALHAHAVSRSRSPQHLLRRRRYARRLYTLSGTGKLIKARWPEPG